MTFCFVRIGGIGSSLFLVLIGYLKCNSLGAMFCITLAVAFIGFHSSGCQISHLDIANNHAGLCLNYIFIYTGTGKITTGKDEHEKKENQFVNEVQRISHVNVK